MNKLSKLLLNQKSGSSSDNEEEQDHINSIEITISNIENKLQNWSIPPSPDYIPGPEVPPSPDYIPGPEGPPSPDYVPGPEEPEQAPPSPVYLPYPLHDAASPTADLPGYIPESDPEEEPEEDDEDPEEDPADYPADGDDDDDEEEEEEHPAPADSVPPVHRMTARISIRDEPSISLTPREEVQRLLALTTPPPSPLTPLSSPLPQIPSPPPNSPIHIEIPESCLPLWKRVHFASPTPSHEVGESLAAGAARQDGPAVAKKNPLFRSKGRPLWIRRYGRCHSWTSDV
ncbi:hypothetical protein Tco_1488228 [Tanacetum coccineum]